MSKIKRIQRDLDAGYTVTRYGTTKALHKQMLDDIKYLNDLAKDNEVLGDVSNSFKSKIKVAGKTIIDNRGKEDVVLHSVVCRLCDSIGW
jgi:hypothetical protein